MKQLLPLLLLAALPAFAQTPAPAGCADAGEQLTETLASAKQRIGHDGEVRVEFEVGADGRAQLLSVDGSRAYRSPTRIAVSLLDCQRGTPQRYVLNIRFADPAPRAVAAAASATLAHARPTPQPR